MPSAPVIHLSKCSIANHVVICLHASLPFAFGSPDVTNMSRPTMSTSVSNILFFKIPRLLRLHPPPLFRNTRSLTQQAQEAIDKSIKEPHITANQKVTTMSSAPQADTTLPKTATDASEPGLVTGHAQYVKGVVNVRLSALLSLLLFPLCSIHFTS